MCFVGVFDVIGFKALRSALGTTGLVQKYERGLLPMVQHSAAGQSKTEERNGVEVSVPDFNENSINYRIFSDTVIYWTSDNTLLSFLMIVAASTKLLSSGFGMKMPVRGAIGYGDLLAKAEIMVGSGIEDAYLWEQQQAWVGVSLTPTCEAFCREHSYVEARRRMFSDSAEQTSDDWTKARALKEARRIVRYDVPLQTNPKDGPVIYSDRESYALDWTLNVFDGASGKCLPESASPHATSLRENTIAFEAWARKAT